MPGHALVTGASGFVGQAVVDELLHRGYAVRALYHHKPLLRANPRFHAIQGDLFDQKTLEKALHGCDSVIHLVGIIRENPRKGITFHRIHFEGTESIVQAAAKAGIQRFVHMSALGARSDAPSQYHRTKYYAEEYVRSSGMNWTIFRPSLIHGPAGEFMQMESRWARKTAPPWLFMPYFGSGLLGFGRAGKIQPVYVNDVARAFVDSLVKHIFVGKIYSLGGPEQFTWREFHQTCARILVGHKRWVFPIPVWWAKTLTHLLPASLLPFNRDQVLMSQEDNICDLGKFQADFGWSPQSLVESLESYKQNL